MTITPDTKDWTWVLDTPCPECMFTAEAVAAGAVAAMARVTAQRWSEVLQREDAAQRFNPQLWSVLEYGCHVRDVFSIFDTRVRRMLDELDPQFANWNQDATAIDDDYASQHPPTVARQLVGAADAVATTLEYAERKHAWERTGRRSDGAVFTIASIARYMIHDPLHHLVDIGLTPDGAGIPS